ncbi:hypothetical protein ACYCAX_12715 [Pseudomonas sp. MT3]|uniref:hypothetical protein n=1 Tax=Pseudomonas sp. ATCC 13867 TaxID=1294143 RepID=UPI0002C4F7DE|nr:hypothetical protein [Pseudomonas sp. ATCC 13867]AGI25570.1 hypothetical protein H681_18515 [Pseudomonas sp. ATCC 13867]RFQ34243.1 hypothetical protein D0N87_10755 [Pseudomonas sp. ATCC 13867]
MSQAFVTVTVSAEHWGRETEAVDNPRVSASLSAPEPGIIKLSFDGQLDAPEEPTHVCVTLENGLSYYGEIKDGAANETGGWLTFDGELIDLEGF